MLNYYALFENSDAAQEAEHGNHPSEPATAGPFKEFFQLTYVSLRFGPDGDSLAFHEDDHWVYEGKFYSDVVMFARDEELPELCDECSGMRYPVEKHDEQCSLYGVKP